jgi:RNA polymerase sigma-70 factor (ECF subfamily)
VAGSDPSQSKNLRRRERFERLKGSLAALSPDHRQVILLARVERLSIEDVARRMDRSPEATRQLLWRAMKQLKASFGETDSLHLPPLNLESRSGPDGE